jgi:hypothetical protein
MPFTVTTPNGSSGKLYAERLADGDMLWRPNKAKATPFTEGEADALAADINRYASTEATVEGLAATPTETEAAMP